VEFLIGQNNSRSNLFSNFMEKISAGVVETHRFCDVRKRTPPQYANLQVERTAFEKSRAAGDGLFFA
jgi:hypothetical protein